jgi:hypothetical protein
MKDEDFEKVIRRTPHQLKDGTHVEIEYVIEIDWQIMREVAIRAARNSSKRSKFGPVIVHHVATMKPGQKGWQK